MVTSFHTEQTGDAHPDRERRVPNSDQTSLDGLALP